MRKIKWSYEKLIEEARKFNSRWDFQKGSGSAYNAAIKLGIMDEISTHMTPKYTYWSDDMIKREAEKYKGRKEFYIGNRKAYDAAVKRGILDKVCAHMELKHYPWTDEELLAEAKKYKSRWEFQSNSKDAYMCAWSRGILNDICSHMEAILTQWDYATVSKEASKYFKRKDFEEDLPGAYGFAVRNKILNDVCSHMPKVNGGYNPDKVGYLYIINIIGMSNSYVGFGISNYISRRLKQHTKTLYNNGFSSSVVKIFKSDNGYLIEDLERHLKHKLDIIDSGMDGFKTEAIDHRGLCGLLDMIDNFIATNDKEMVYASKNLGGTWVRVSPKRHGVLI